VSDPLEFARPDGRAPLRITPTPGKLSITPASRLCFEVLYEHAELIAGRGIDWGSGSGILAVAAATLPRVELVVGLELEEADVATARRNAELNRVAERTMFVRADLFQPFPDEESTVLEDLHGTADFLLANPPASVGDDGLEWRRAVLHEARRYLRSGAEVLLQVSRQYGVQRIESLASDGYRYRGLLGASGWQPFDMDRADLRRAVEDFAAEEERGGLHYPFLDGQARDEIDARTALSRWRASGVSPHSQWQVHRFERD
jgi:methylase of polypeptide subunit release factors